MKNFIILGLCMVGIFCSCTEKKTAQNSDSQLSTQEIQEVQKLESENETLDEIQNEIQKTSQELDALLEEIDK